MKNTKVNIRTAFILATTMLCAVFCQGQSTKNAIDKTKHFFMSVPELQIVGSTKKIVAYKMKDSSLVVIDSAETIKVLLKTIKSIQKQNEKLYAAQDILNYINTQGYVLNKDRGKFNNAVKDYFNSSDNKTSYKKMQKLDILVKSIKGKAIGWVSQ